MTLVKIQQTLRKESNVSKAKVLQRFFKTGPGEYGEGDQFLGITVPVLRKLAKQFRDISLTDLTLLMRSPIHEERLIAVLICVLNYQKAATTEQQKIFQFYIKQWKGINNWDLVDLSASHIVGHFLYEHSRQRDLLEQWSVSKSLWQRRIAIIATHYFIRRNEFRLTFRTAEILMDDKEDLIHKAVGWMLREVGKRDLKQEKRFLDQHAMHMPRTMLRYAIERFPETERQFYLAQGKSLSKRGKRLST